MHISIINDCDDNAVQRQAARVGSLFPDHSVSTINVSKFNEISAAGNLIDTLDAYEDREGLIIVNSAPRHGKAKKWKNGTPFGYFKYNNVIVITTIDGATLSLVKKFGLVDAIKLTDIEEVITYLYEKNVVLNKELIQKVATSQFRSFDYEPRLARWVYDNHDIPTEEYKIKNVQDSENCVWWIDNFGNVKTTLLPEDIDFEEGKVIKTNFGDLTCVTQLRNVKPGEAALTIGSSGIEDNRFIEIVLQGAPANIELGINLGDQVLF